MELSKRLMLAHISLAHAQRLTGSGKITIQHHAAVAL